MNAVYSTESKEILGQTANIQSEYTVYLVTTRTCI